MTQHVVSQANKEMSFSVFAYTILYLKVAALSSSNLAEVLACNLHSSMNYSRALWNLFFKKFAASLDEALDAYSNMVGNEE